MRDYKTRKSFWGFNVVYNPPHCSTSGEKVISTLGGSFRSHDSGRADILPGDHKSPTKYWAFRRSMTPGKPSLYHTTREYRKWCGTKYEYRAKEYKGTHYPQVESLQLTNLSGNVRKPIVSSNVLGRARNSCLHKIASRNLDLGQAFGEVIANAGELRGMGILGTQMLLAFRRRQWSRLNFILTGYLRSNGGVPGRLTSRPITRAADWYLLYQYGLKPIMSDAFAASAAINEALTAPDSYYRAKGTAVYDKGEAQVSSYSFSGKILQGAEVGVMYKIDNPTIHKLNQFGLSNPVATLWAVAPLSFVVDWFLSIGPFLDNLSATQGLEFVSGYETTFVKTQCNVEWDPGYRYAVTKAPNWRLNEFGMNRVVLDDFPIPAVTFRLSLELQQLTSILAMLASSRS